MSGEDQHHINVQNVDQNADIDFNGLSNSGLQQDGEDINYFSLL
jgi:hypothetical protein